MRGVMDSHSRCLRDYPVEASLLRAGMIDQPIDQRVASYYGAILPQRVFADTSDVYKA